MHGRLYTILSMLALLSFYSSVQSPVLHSFPTRRSSDLIVEMVRLMRAGLPTAFTIDGPKGPRYVAKMGAVLLAKKTGQPDRKSTRLNSSHLVISYAAFCLKNED